MSRRLPSFDDPAPLLARRLVQLFVGLFLYGIAISMIVRAALGVSPWDVLSQGLALHTGLSFGVIVTLTSGVVLLLWIPLRQRLGFGTIMNAVLIGPSADLGLFLIPEQLDLWARILLLPAGILLLALASGLYIGSGFGPGPRDGLMTGLHRVTGWRIWIVRTGIEVTVLAIGWLLGGDVGLGTVLFAVTIGPLCGWTIPRFTVARSGRSRAESVADAESGQRTSAATDPARPAYRSPSA